METRLQKWGNSLGVRIPSRLLQRLDLHEGTRVEITIEDGKIIIYLSPHYDLDEMLAKVTKENCHHLIFDDKSKGEEAW